MIIAAFLLLVSCDRGGGHFGSSTGAKDDYYFGGTDGTTLDLVHWKNNGTAVGTVTVTDTRGNLVPMMATDNQIMLKTAIGTIHYFPGYDQVHGTELWRSYGTTTVTRMVKKIGAGLSLPAGYYDQCDDSVTGAEFWKSDGTEAGTVLVKDINPAGSSYPDYLAYVGGKVFFAASDSGGYRLWITDGTDGGTRLVKDVYLTGGGGST